MTRTRKQWVRPATVREDRWELRSFDYLWSAVPNVPVVYDFAAVLDAGKLRAGLALALDRFPPFAGRVRSRRGRLSIVLAGEGMGVPFEECEGGDVYPSGQKCHIFPHEPYYDFGPVLSVKLRRSRHGGCTLSIGWVHVASDASSMIEFLQSWSHYCGGSAALPPAPVLDRALPAALEHLPDARAVRAARFTPAQLLSAVPQVARSVLCDPVLDVRVTTESLKRLKKRVAEGLDKDEWVSTTEVLFGLISQALVSADGRGPEGGDLVGRWCVNTRGRGSLTPPGFVGNGLNLLTTTTPVTPQPRGDAPGALESLRRVTLAMHAQLRECIADPAKVDACTTLLEQGLRTGQLAGYVNRMCWTKPYCETITEPRRTIFNSWTAFDWFRGLDFGAGQTPTHLRVAPYWTHRQYYFVTPFDAAGEEISIRVHMRPAHVGTFVDHLRQAGLVFRDCSVVRNRRRTKAASFKGAEGAITPAAS